MISLLPQEENIRFEKIYPKNLNNSAEYIEQKYLKGEIRIITEQARYPLPTIADMVNSKKYNINPTYQRRAKWDIEKKSRLIESLIINVPVPPIFLYEVGLAKYELMDGLQRITSIHEFYNDRFKLDGLEEWPELNGYTYSMLPEKIRDAIDRRYISSIILLYETAKNEEQAKFMKKIVFERLNTGGEKLRPQEIRNAIYEGRMNKLCMELSKNDIFCDLWGIPREKDNAFSTQRAAHPYVKDMEDIELVLRFFAFRHIYKVTVIPSFSEFFDAFLEQANNLSSSVIESYKDLFENTICLAADIFGLDAFKIWTKRRDGEWKLYNKCSKVVYDPLMIVLSQNLDKSEILISKKLQIKKDMKEFYIANEGKFEGRNTNKKDLETRIELFTSFIQKYLGDK